jgi:hypothetical protein
MRCTHSDTLRSRWRAMNLRFSAVGGEIRRSRRKIVEHRVYEIDL